MVVHVDPDHTLLYFEHRADISPSDDVEWWGVEGVDQVIDEGGPRDWMKLAEAIALDPLGLPGQYLRNCPAACAERVEVADVCLSVHWSRVELTEYGASSTTRMSNPRPTARHHGSRSLNRGSAIAPRVRRRCEGSSQIIEWSFLI